VQDYLRRLPGQWDESRFLDGYPGKFVVIARRAGARWYVAGINGAQEPMQLDLDLSFIPADKGMLIRDGDRPRELQLHQIAAGRQQLALPAASGFVMLFDN
jgi:alpha-glucosidase